MNALEEPREPYLINIYLCATAQHIIYATPAIYYYCKTRFSNGTSGKSEFKELGGPRG